MTETEEQICASFSYGLASSLGKTYRYMEHRHEALDFVDGMHVCVVTINNQLREEFREASGSWF